jgi:hypothetical protein
MWLACVLAGLAACAGEIDPSLIPTANNPAGQAGSGGTAPCDAPKMVFATSCGIPGCHAAGSTSGAGLDLASAGVVGRLVGQGPSTNTSAGALCADVGKTYLVAGSNPATGLLMDKIDATKVTCGSAMSLLGGLNSSQITCLTAWATGVTTGVVTQ